MMDRGHWANLVRMAKEDGLHPYSFERLGKILGSWVLSEGWCFLAV